VGVDCWVATEWGQYRPTLASFGHSSLVAAAAAALELQSLSDNRSPIGSLSVCKIATLTMWHWLNDTPEQCTSFCLPRGHSLVIGNSSCILLKLILLLSSLDFTFKVTIRPDFTRTVPNFDGLSRENYQVSRDAELSRIRNPVPILFRILYRFCPALNIMYRHVFTKFIPMILIPITSSLSSDAFFPAQNAPNPLLINRNRMGCTVCTGMKKKNGRQV